MTRGDTNGTCLHKPTDVHILPNRPSSKNFTAPETEGREREKMIINTVRRGEKRGRREGDKQREREVGEWRRGGGE